jgi:hypothetical protein
MTLKTLTSCVLGTFLALAPACAQVTAELVASSSIPAGNAFAPHTPSGTVIIGNNLWVGDEAQGLRHYVPVDPANADPLNSGKLMFDIDSGWSVGGGANPEILAALAYG